MDIACHLRRNTPSNPCFNTDFIRTKVRFCVNLIHFFYLSAVTFRFFAYYKVERRTFHPLSSFMGSSWSLLTLFLVYSYPNERLGLLSRRLLEPLSKVSLTSPEGLGLLSATSILGLCYAYPTPTLRPCYDIATTYERRRNDLAMCRFSQRQQKP